MRRQFWAVCLVLTLAWFIAASVSAETLHLKSEFLKSYSSGNEKNIGEMISKTQGTNRTLRVILATENDIVNKLKKEMFDRPDSQSVAKQDVEYRVDERPMLYILHGMSGNGADDMRGMKITKAEFKRAFTYVDDDTNKKPEPQLIEIEVEKPETTWVPVDSAIGTSDVRYINARIFLESLTPGVYDIECTLKTTYIEASGSRRNEGVDKITKVETTPLASFRLRLN
ncbi:MAG: hypothetical protein GX569_14720 [Candidatus Riflebacteria bacterium]|nr:hypothetical protein [Candidatus Riflebacteria bacterium]